MCGIWSYLAKNTDKLDLVKLYDSFLKIQHRGPDRSDYVEVNDIIELFIGFHRLGIMDPTADGDQPFHVEVDNRTVYCICNGEIFDFHKIRDKFDLQTKSKSDCEVILRNSKITLNLVL